MHNGDIMGDNVGVMDMLPTSHSAVQSGAEDACVTQPCTHKQEKGPPKTAGECVSKHETRHDYIVTKKARARAV